MPKEEGKSIPRPRAQAQADEDDEAVVEVDVESIHRRILGQGLLEKLLSQLQNSLLLHRDLHDAVRYPLQQFLVFTAMISAELLSLKVAATLT